MTNADKFQLTTGMQLFREDIVVFEKLQFSLEFAF